MLQLFPSFLDVSRSFAGRLRDERQGIDPSKDRSRISVTRSRSARGSFLTISWTQPSDTMSRDITRVHQIRSLTRPIHLPERRQSIGVDGFWSILLKHRWHEAKDQRRFGILKAACRRFVSSPHQGCYGWSGRIRHRRTAAGGVVGEVRGAARDSG